MNLYQQFDERSFMQLGLNDRALQAGLGFVAHATVWPTASSVRESGYVASGSTSARELREQILACMRDDGKAVRRPPEKFTL